MSKNTPQTCAPVVKLPCREICAAGIGVLKPPLRYKPQPFARSCGFPNSVSSFGGSMGSRKTRWFAQAVASTPTYRAAPPLAWGVGAFNTPLGVILTTSPSNGAATRQPSRVLTCDEQHRLNIDAAIAAEGKAVASIKRMARNNSVALQTLWHWGDGQGGGILDMIAHELGLRSPSAPLPPTYKVVKGKKVIPSDLRTKVFERDAYRCKHCDTHLNLTVDHIKAESKGGTLDFDNLQTLCRPCNSSKGAK